MKVNIPQEVHCTCDYNDYEIPDEVATQGKKAVEKYIRDHYDEIPAGDIEAIQGTFTLSGDYLDKRIEEALDGFKNEKIAMLKKEIEERLLDRQYADSWEQSRQISEDIKRLEKEIKNLKEEKPEIITNQKSNQEMRKILEKYIYEQFECGEAFVFVAKDDMRITGRTTKPMYDENPELCSYAHFFGVGICAGDEVWIEPDKTFYVNGVLAEGRSVSMHESRIMHTIDITSILDNYDKLEEKETRMISTNAGKVPIADYREIKAHQEGFDSYKDLYQQGFRLGEGLDKNPLLDDLLREKEVTKVVIDWDMAK